MKGHTSSYQRREAQREQRRERLTRKGADREQRRERLAEQRRAEGSR